MRKGLLAVSLCLAVCALGRASDEISVIASDQGGHQIVKHVSRKNYVKAMAAVVTSVQEEALPALERAKAGRKWKIRTISLGVGLDLSLGLSPIIAFGIAPRINAILCKGTDPIMP